MTTRSEITQFGIEVVFIKIKWHFFVDILSAACQYLSVFGLFNDTLLDV
jgi:hypothetical protein